MGFNFSRGGGVGGGGGGAIARQPLEFGGFIGRGVSSWAFPYSPPVTSPQFALNNPLQVYGTFSQAFTYALQTTNATSLSTSFTIGSTYWVDMVFFGGDLNANDLSQVNISVNGTSISPFYGIGFAASFVNMFDVYGYGASLTMTATFTTSRFGALYVAPVMARTIISTGGSVVWPPRLSGQSVTRDI